ncbi:MAG: MFS transporter [Desulfobacterales bacterium]
MFKIILCFCANILCFLNRVNISIAAPFMMNYFGWDENQMGAVFSAFFFGYVIFMIPGGLLADRFGSNKVLASGVAFWSLFSFLTPFFSGIWSMAFCRYLIGTGQGVHYPSINNFIANKVHFSDRAKVQGFTLSGNTIGVVLGLPLGSWIILNWGWPSIFYVFGLLGIIWLVFWIYFTKDELSNLSRMPKQKREPVPWRRLLSHRSSLGLTLSYFCHNYAAYMFLAWLPTYLIKVHGLSLAATGLATTAPPLTAGIFMNISGWFSDSLIKKGKSREFSRKFLLFIGMGLSGCLLLPLIWLQNPYMIIAFLTLSSAARAISSPIYWALSVDMAPNHAGFLSSIMNTSGNVAGIVATALTGWLVATFADWNLAILISSATTLLGVVIALPTIRTSAIV